jgi:hypothetical protein
LGERVDPVPRPNLKLMKFASNGESCGRRADCL